MPKYNLEISEDEMAWLQKCDFENLLDDMSQMCDLIDSLNIDDDEIYFEK